MSDHEPVDEASSGGAPDWDDPQAVAESSAAAMLAGDAASAGLGIELIEVGPSRARMRMEITASMVNGHAIAHGGLVFALADSAFAVACNSHGTVTVAAGADVTFVASAKLGDVLIADAVEHARFGRSGLTDVTVTRQGDGALIATFRGRSRSLGRPIGGQGRD